MVDAHTKTVLAGIPLLKTNAGPRDPGWNERLKEELMSLIQVRCEYVRGTHSSPVCEEQQGTGQ